MTDITSQDLVLTTPLELEIRRLLAEHREGAKQQAEAEARAAKRSAWRWCVCSCALALVLAGTVAAGSYFGHQRIVDAEDAIVDLTANQIDIDRVVQLHEARLRATKGPL